VSLALKKTRNPGNDIEASEVSVKTTRNQEEKLRMHKNAASASSEKNSEEIKAEEV